jgi:O-antigen ligase
MAIVAFMPYYLHISNTLIGLTALFTVVRMVSLRRWDFRQLDILSWTVVGYFFLEVLGLIHTAPENLKIGLAVLEKHQAFVLMPLIFADFEIDVRKRESILASFVLGCFVGVIICVAVNMYTGLTLYDQYFHEWLFTHDRFSGPIRLQAVYFSLYIGLCILILIHFYFEGITIFSKIEKAGFAGIEKDSIRFLFLIFFIVLITLGSRTIIVSVVLISLAYLVTYALSKKAYKVLLIAAIIPVILVGFIFINPVVKMRFMDLAHQRSEVSNYGSYFARLDIWRPGIEAIKENVLIGVGTGDHQTEMNKKYEKYNYSEGVRLEFNIHNQYLHTLMNHGIPGLLLLLLVFGGQIKQGIKQRDWLYLSFVGLFMLACLTESTLVRNKGIIFLLIFSFVFFKTKNRK